MYFIDYLKFKGPLLTEMQNQGEQCENVLMSFFAKNARGFKTSIVDGNNDNNG